MMPSYISAASHAASPGLGATEEELCSAQAVTSSYLYTHHESHRDMNEIGRSGLVGGRVAKALSEECRMAASCESTEEKPLMLTTDRRLERYSGWSPYLNAKAAAVAIPFPMPT